VSQDSSPLGSITRTDSMVTPFLRLFGDVDFFYPLFFLLQHTVSYLFETRLSTPPFRLVKGTLSPPPMSSFSFHYRRERHQLFPSLIFLKILHHAFLTQFRHGVLLPFFSQTDRSVRTVWDRLFLIFFPCHPWGCFFSWE